MPPRSVKHGLGRASTGWTGSPGRRRGSPCTGRALPQGNRPGSEATQGRSPGVGQRDRLPGGREEKSSPAVPGRGRNTRLLHSWGASQRPRPAGREAASTRASTSLWVCYSSLKCKGLWHDWLSVYKCRWGEGSGFLTPCGFPTLKAARATRGGRKGKEKRISQLQHSSDLPCHCTTRCSVCRTLRARGHANDTGMKEPWQE